MHKIVARFNPALPRSAVSFVFKLWLCVCVRLGDPECAAQLEEYYATGAAVAHADAVAVVACRVAEVGAWPATNPTTAEKIAAADKCVEATYQDAANNGTARKRPGLVSPQSTACLSA